MASTKLEYWENRLKVAWTAITEKRKKAEEVIPEPIILVFPTNKIVGIPDAPYKLDGPDIPPAYEEVEPDYVSQKEAYIQETIQALELATEAARKNYYNFIKPAISAKRKSAFVKQQREIKKAGKQLDKQIKLDNRKLEKQIRAAAGPAKPPKPSRRKNKPKVNMSMGYTIKTKGGPDVPPAKPIYHHV